MKHTPFGRRNNIVEHRGAGIVRKYHYTTVDTVRTENAEDEGRLWLQIR